MINMESLGAIPNVGSLSIAFGTPLAIFIPPWRGASGSPPLLYRAGGDGLLAKPRAFTHLTQIIYTAAGTAHDVVVMRPLNYAVVSGAVAANATVVNVVTDPGLYSTNYKYPLAGGLTKPISVANSGIAANDYVAVQLLDGTWLCTTVASVSTLALTLTAGTPNVTGAGIADGSILYHFGISTDVDPAIGTAHPKFTSVASARTNLLPGIAGGTISTLHAGDPMIVYSGNATATGGINAVTGFYADR